MKELYILPIKREQGKLYFVKSGEDGFLVVCEAILKRGGRKKKHEKKQ
jgi:hypothetical protein